MKTKFAISIIVVVTFATVANGQDGYFKYRSVTSSDKYLSFPVFSRDTVTGPVKKINHFLQLLELELLDGHQSKNIFEVVSVDKGTIYGGKVNLAYKVLSNSSRLLSLKFDESSCGATCAYWVVYYNFNSGNGDLVQLKDLFTKEGFAIFSKKIAQRRSAKFKQQIKGFDTMARKDLQYISEAFAGEELHDFYITKTSIIIDGENMLSKNEKFLGLDMTVTFRLKEFENYLNEYGKVVFQLKEGSIAAFRSHQLPQLLEGTISNSEKIIMIVNHDYENKMRGIYAYLKYGRGIYLEGEMEKQQLTMTEFTSDLKENAHILATFDGEALSGTWTQKGKTKSRKIVAKRL